MSVVGSTLGVATSGVAPSPSSVPKRAMPYDKVVGISPRRESSPRFSLYPCVVAEDIGEQGPWDEDLTGDVILVVGAEREGVSEPVLEAADAVVKLPMDGFVPSYNLQVAVSVLAVEALRQRESRGK